jgi:hypothetical protein
MNLCRTCGQDFGSLGAFDSHRVGSYAVDFSLEHPEGRRCLDVDELEALGWRRDRWGRWRTPVDDSELPPQWRRRSTGENASVSSERRR